MSFSSPAFASHLKALAPSGDVIALVKTVLGFCALGGAAATVWFVLRHPFAVPIYDDMFDRLRMYRAIDDHAFWSWLFSPHNEHRIATTRVFALVDEFLLGGRERLQVAATIAFQTAAAVVLAFVLAREGGRRLFSAAGVFAFATAILLFVNPCFLYTLIVPFQLPHAIMAFLTALAACALWRMAAVEGGPTAANAPWHFAALLVLALTASFTLGNAPVILIAAVVVAIALRWPPRTVVLLLAAALLHVAVAVATTRASGATGHDALSMLRFALLYLGGPFSRLDPWPATYATYAASQAAPLIAGGFVLAIGVVYGLLRLIRPQSGGALGAFGLALLAAVVVTALAAALSRAQFGALEAVNKKYASYAALGSGRRAVVAIDWLRAWARTRERALDLVGVALLVVLLSLTAATYSRETRIWRKATERNWEAATALAMQVDAPQLKDIYTEPERLKDYLAYVEPHDRGVYAQLPFRWGEKASALLAKKRETTCRGSAEDVLVVPPGDRVAAFGAPGTPAQIRGWAWMDRAGAAYVIAVDPQDRVVGVARSTRRGEIAEEWLGQKLDGDVGWFGFARVEETPLKFYALSANGRRYCALGGVGEVR